ncbi:OmpA/MotB family protein [Nitrincola tapanii]|uniref:Flagellar motor protein n=1 Tax=Nitrincola tapanii TaxID=1708751 RepID=A0A5A9VZU8_9GAMM|nr:flagellar motor protein MotB [Nitrincola tapanii]KAA0874027.1 flagellar motor protein [Nitrincola tapanii]
MSSRKQQLMDEEGPGWLTTYADLMTLLLVFFVLLFSVSNIEKEAFEQTARSLNIALSRDTALSSLIPLEAPAPDTARIPELETPIIPYPTDAQLADEFRLRQALVDAANLELQDIVQDLESSLAHSEMGSWVEIGEPRDGRLTLRISGALLFEPGSAEIKRAMMPILDSLLELVLANPAYKLEVLGHTDNTPISTPIFPSNWELSAVRATTVLRFLIDGGLPPERASASGYADSLPLASNTTEAGRAANRRIEFVLEKKELPRL